MAHQSAEPIWRVVEKEWKDFIEAFTDVIVANDPQIPYLPPKDVVHRIYRDVSHIVCLCAPCALQLLIM